jgi:hypothetical protein
LALSRFPFELRHKLGGHHPQADDPVITVSEAWRRW